MSIGVEFPPSIADNRVMATNNRKEAMTHGFIIQITGDQMGELPTPEGLIYGPFSMGEATKARDAWKSIGYDVSIKPLRSTNEHLTNLGKCARAKVGTMRTPTPRFECSECGWSKFYCREEFADGTPGDKTRICSDCGWVEGTKATGSHLHEPMNRCQ